ncbi:Ribonuclease Z [uncultured archaeon]|nr:Ribonuclease Z [uncultured archaeon]
MEFVILGSGGATATPRPYCQCNVCKKARKLGEPYKRNSSSLFIKDINGVIDCGEDIADSLNRRNIKKVENLFITHWHPDHTFGLRLVLESCFDFRTNKAVRRINVYLSKRVFKDLENKMNVLNYYANVIKVAKIHFIEHNQMVKIGKLKIIAIGYTGKNSNTFSFLFKEGKKRVLYAPCDTIRFAQKILNLDLLINECGLFSYKTVKSEISFPSLMNRIKELNPKRTILTHIEELELQNWGINYLRKMKNKYADSNFDFAYDGMEIKV